MRIKGQGQGHSLTLSKGHLETTLPFESKFHMISQQSKEIKTDFLNVLGHRTKMGTMSIYGKNSENFLQNQCFQS